MQKQRFLSLVLLVLGFCQKIDGLDSQDHYKVLGVSRTATDNVIRVAYKKRALLLHPDKNPAGEEKFKKLNAAYEVLKDAISRRKYDATLPPITRQFAQQPRPASPSYFPFAQGSPSYPAPQASRHAPRDTAPRPAPEPAWMKKWREQQAAHDETSMAKATAAMNKEVPMPNFPVQTDFAIWQNDFASLNRKGTFWSMYITKLEKWLGENPEARELQLKAWLNDSGTQYKAAIEHSRKLRKSSAHESKPANFRPTTPKPRPGTASKADKRDSETLPSPTSSWTQPNSSTSSLTSPANHKSPSMPASNAANDWPPAPLRPTSERLPDNFNDPEPVKPRKPELSKTKLLNNLKIELYNAEMEEYEANKKAWELRQARRKAAANV